MMQILVHLPCDEGGRAGARGAPLEGAGSHFGLATMPDSGLEMNRKRWALVLEITTV